MTVLVIFVCFTISALFSYYSCCSTGTAVTRWFSSITLNLKPRTTCVVYACGCISLCRNAARRVWTRDTRSIFSTRASPPQVVYSCDFFFDSERSGERVYYWFCPSLSVLFFVPWKPQFFASLWIISPTHTARYPSKDDC